MEVNTMKAINLAKGISKLLALMLAMVMLFTACGGNPEDDPANADGSSSTSETNNDQTSSGEVTDNTSSKTGGGGGDQGDDGDGQTTGNVWEADYLKNIPANVKSKGLHVLMWRKYTKTEQAAVNAFMKATGIDVKTTVSTEAQYGTKLASLISGKDSPDVVCVQSERFPGFVIKSMNPLNEKTFRLKDPIWYKAYMDCYKVNNKYFAVAINGTWSCEDCNYVTYYNPNILSGMSDPYELYKQGKWDWAAAEEIARKVVAKGSSYSGISLQDKDLYMHTAGVDFITYNGQKFTNTLSNSTQKSKLVNAWTELSSLVSDGLIKGWDPQGLSKGQVGLFSAISYGLYNEGGWFDSVATKGGVGALKAVPMAGPTQDTAYVPTRPKAWGVAKGAKNPEGAAYFLRYFLDPANSNMNGTFYNSQFGEVFNIISRASTKKSIKVASGVIEYSSSGAYSTLQADLSNATPSQINTVLNSKNGIINNAVNRANAEISRIR